ncbi:DUF1877 family protein [Nocardia thraciensis]
MSVRSGSVIGALRDRLRGRHPRYARRIWSVRARQLARHFDAERMTAQEVYPNIWLDGDDALDYLRANYLHLVRFFEFAAADGSGAVMSFG